MLIIISQNAFTMPSFINLENAKMKKTLLIIVSFLSLCAACTPTRPYEITSPCVAIESSDPSAVSPCIRRPANDLNAIL